jgi:LPS-assembly protein
VKLFQIIIASALVSGATVLRAQQGPELSADSPIAYSEETGLLIAAGNAVFVDENTIVEADLIRYNRNTEAVEALGNVTVTREGVRLLAERVTYDAKTRSFEALDFRVGYPPLFIEGQSFSGTQSTVNFADISVFFREPVQSAPRIRVKSGQWVEDTYLKAEGIRLNVFGGLGLPLPNLTYAFGQPDVDIEASLGYTNFLGLYAQSAWLVPTTTEWALGGNLDLYSKRGILIGPRLNWTGADGRIRLGLDTGWIHDHSFEERGVDALGQRIEQDRGFVKVTIDAASADAAVQFKSRGEWLSDSEVLRDFRENRYLRDSQPDGFAELTWQTDRFIISAFGRSRLNNGYAFIEKLPSLQAEWLPRQIASTGLVLQARASATRYRQYDPAIGQFLFPETPFYQPASAGISGLSRFLNRLDAVATVTRPVLLPQGLQLILRSGARWTRWDEENGEVIDQRWIGELGWDLRQSRSRSYTVDWEALDIERLVHRSTLQIQHRYHRWDAAALDLPISMDASSYRPYAPLMDLADLEALDTLRAGHHVRLGWENTLLSGSVDAVSRRLMSLHFYQDFVETHSSGSLDSDALYTALQFQPAEWVSIAWNLKFLPEAFQTEASWFTARIRSADLWDLRLQTEFVEGAIQQYGIQGTYRIGENIGLLAAAQYDARIGAWTRQRYGFSRRFGNVWELELYLSLTDADERQDKASVGLRVNWLSF